MPKNRIVCTAVIAAAILACVPACNRKVIDPGPDLIATTAEQARGRQITSLATSPDGLTAGAVFDDDSLCLWDIETAEQVVSSHVAKGIGSQFTRELVVTNDRTGLIDDSFWGAFEIDIGTGNYRTFGGGQRLPDSPNERGGYGFSLAGETRIFALYHTEKRWTKIMRMLDPIPTSRPTEHEAQKESPRSSVPKDCIEPSLAGGVNDRVLWTRQDDDWDDLCDLSQDATRLAMQLKSGNIQIWDIPSDTIIRSIPHEPGQCCVVFTRDGSRLAITTLDCLGDWPDRTCIVSIEIHDLQVEDDVCGLRLGQFEIREPSRGRVEPVFSYDGYAMAVLLNDKVHVFDVETGVSQGTLGSDPIESVKATRRGWVTSSGELLTLWDGATLEPAGILQRR